MRRSDSRRTSVRTLPELGFTIEPSGAIHRPLILGTGVEVTGQLLNGGKPVSGVSIGLKYIDLDSDPYSLEPLETKTDSEGRFCFAHVLPERGFWAYAKPGSLPDGGATIPMQIKTMEHGSAMDVGVLHVEKGRTLAGRLVCSDGEAVPEGLVLRASCPYADGDLEQNADSPGGLSSRAFPTDPSPWR